MSFVAAEVDSSATTGEHSSSSSSASVIDATCTLPTNASASTTVVVR